MLETKIVEHEIPTSYGNLQKKYEVIYNAAEPDDDDDTWFSCHSSEPELWLSYGFYDEPTANYIASGIERGQITVKTYK